MEKLIAKTLKELIRGKRTITLSIAELLKVKATPEQTKPVITFTPTAYAQMKELVSHFSSEVAWHGVVHREGTHFTVSRIIVYPQLVTSGTVESDDENYSKFLDTLPDDVYNHIRLQGHSHVNMGVSPSGTDLDFYDQLMEHIPDFYITLIINKSGAVWVELYDIPMNVVYETTDLILEKPVNDFIEGAQLMIKPKVNLLKGKYPTKFQELDDPLENYRRLGGY